MEVDAAPPDDIATAVRIAREELAGVVRALTQVLSAVAESEPAAEKPANGPETEAARKEREAAQQRRSLAPVLSRFDALRTAVDAAVGLHATRVAAAVKEESDVSPDEKVALVERRAALVDEVRAKNEKIKVLVDHLRELHRDIVVLLASYIKPIPSQTRKA